MKDHSFNTVKEIQKKTQNVLEKEFVDTFQAWKKQQIGCVDLQGDYFDGDGSHQWPR